jgi:F-type H+-transporting ATPase subunit c
MNLLNSFKFLAEGAADNVFSAAGFLYLGVGIIMLAMGLSSIAEGLVVSNAIKGMARNPEASKTLRSSMILGVSLCETVAIYGLVLAILLIFVAGPGTFQA